MPKFRKKPVVIEAEKWDGENAPSFMHDENGELIPSLVIMNLDPSSDAYMSLTFTTLEGNMRASLGDWIIKGVNGEFYPCKPDIFEKTYEAVDE